MTAKGTSDGCFDSFNGKCTHDGNFKHFTSNVLSISYFQASIKHSFRLKICEWMFDFDFFDQWRYDFFFDKVDTNQMVLRLDSIVFGLFFRDSFDDCEFVFVVYQMLHE